MTITAASFEAACVQAGITMLSNSANFRTLVGVATPALALPSIVEEFGGFKDLNVGADFTATNGSQLTITPTTSFASVMVGPITRTSLGITGYERTGRCSIMVAMPAQFAALTVPQAMRNARNVLGGIRSDIEQQRGNAGCYGVFVIDTDGPTVESETSADHDFLVFTIHLDFIA